MFAHELDYDLPERLIAKRPPAERDGARLLVLGDALLDSQVRELAEHIPSGSLLVLNNTRVIRARVHAEREGTGGKVEILFLAPAPGSLETAVVWEALVRANRSLPDGARLRVGDVSLRLLGRNDEGGTWVEASEPISGVIERHGHVPLPPYIRREDDAEDTERYQTVFATEAGSVAAPTAGLHLTAATMQRLQARDVEIGYVTLHVGAGTFRPVNAPHLSEHRMHQEHYVISSQINEQVQSAKRRGAQVVAVGTTVVRALESAAAEGEQGSGGPLAVGSLATRLLISPGYKFKVVDALLTNFHAPRSTLLALVYAFAGTARIRAAYRHAIEQEYRFLSYGDAMWIPQRCD